ncbi:methylenetetrahydrofolate reductase C-terminal domain-containing protein [Frondihabitans sp. VKM Ac-2883]|nr:methylenetetrahydrofolate reductase C-terminal domain-containing protein [Frondihabitans sp. VKM Ac-2883]
MDETAPKPHPGCPKSMVYGPCGGVEFDGTCEVAEHACPFLDGPTVRWPAPALSVPPASSSGPGAAMRDTLAKRQVVVADFPGRALDAVSGGRMARILVGSVDAGLAGDSGSERVQFPPACLGEGCPAGREGARRRRGLLREPRGRCGPGRALHRGGEGPWIDRGFHSLHPRRGRCGVGATARVVHHTGAARRLSPSHPRGARPLRFGGGSRRRDVARDAGAPRRARRKPVRRGGVVGRVARAVRGGAGCCGAEALLASRLRMV